MYFGGTDKLRGSVGKRERDKMWRQAYRMLQAHRLIPAGPGLRKYGETMA